eukprot:CAMPEP_0118932818 /NCGR_PEP_ID=MMETSP1169-20130426/10636_1 /TAXON_ID=36882 /ORGANISM="Pyramimonas obovata, Strain CCMP722" /LENGTH=199 /DNA_ID=CAMNT_0006875519 /DNA_START=119 /DNA_END=718 /DNA_ORIENTATION=-
MQCTTPQATRASLRSDPAHPRVLARVLRTATRQHSAYEGRLCTPRTFSAGRIISGFASTRRTIGVSGCQRTETPLVEDSRDTTHGTSVGDLVEMAKTPAVLLAVAALTFTVADTALAEGVFAGSDSFVGGGDGFGDDEYVYRTRDLAVDVVSPLVAYKVVTLALGQENPKWLDAIILVATLGAAYVVFAGVDTFDKYLA